MNICYNFLYIQAEQTLNRFNNIDSIELDLHINDTHDIDSMNCNSFSVSKEKYENCKENTSDTAPLFPVCKCEIYILNCKLFRYLKKV